MRLPLSAWLVAFVFALTLTGCGRWTAPKRAVTMEQGDRIVAAIWDYKKHHGRLPQALDALVPTYLAEIPPPVVGNRRWEYCGGAADGTFELFVSDDNERPAHLLSYRSTAGKWDFLLE